MGLLGGLLLIGDQVGHQGQQLVVQFRGGGRVQDHRHTGRPGPMGHRPVHLNGDLQLQKHHIKIRNGIPDPADLIHRQRPVGTGNHHNTVLGGVLRDLQSHVAHTGMDAGVHHHMAGVHAGSLEGFQQLLAEQVVTDRAHHGDLRPQAGTLQRLVGPLSARGHVEGLPINRLSGAGDLLRCGDDIHNKAADNQNAGFLMYHSIAPALQRITASDVLYSYYSGLGKRYKSFLKKPPEND